MILAMKKNAATFKDTGYGDWSICSVPGTLPSALFVFAYFIGWFLQTRNLKLTEVLTCPKSDAQKMTELTLEPRL